MVSRVRGGRPASPHEAGTPRGRTRAGTHTGSAIYRGGQGAGPPTRGTRSTALAAGEIGGGWGRKSVGSSHGPLRRGERCRGGRARRRRTVCGRARDASPI